MLGGFRIEPGPGRRCLALVLGLVAANALATPAAAEGLVCSAPQQPMQQIELMFGRNIGGRLGVSETAWSRFLAREVTPRFPDGFTIYEASGQWWNTETHSVGREHTKVIVISAEDTALIRTNIAEVSDAYRKIFHQQSVGIVSNQGCSAF